MNPQEKRNYEQRSQEVGKEHPYLSQAKQIGQSLRDNLKNLPIEQSALNQAKTWFNGLNPVGKSIVVVMGISLGFTVVNSLLQLVGSLISLAILGGILYLVYKFFLTPLSPK
jgi:Flp pilus assembly protein TadB